RSGRSSAVEWVQITAKTVEEARERALDTLGVDEQDVEIVVLEEPRTGLFGRLKGQALIRARIRPTPVRPKVERRERRGRKGDQRGKDRPNGRGRSAERAPDRSATAGDDQPSATEAAEPVEGAAAGRQGTGGSKRRRG